MKYRYQDCNLPEEERVNDLLSHMTLEEKFSQIRMNGKINNFFADKNINKDNFETEFAEVYDSDKTSCCYLSFDVNPKIVNMVQKYVIEHSRLGIPILFMGESVHGAMLNGTTVFPQAIGLGATFDPDLVGRMAGVCGRESRAFGVRMTYAPDLDISQDPRWGRVEENYGEDSFLTSKMAVAYVKNFQKEGVAACPKHYLAHGTPECGVNIGPVHIGEREIREQMLPTFAAAVQEGGAYGIMPAYSEVEGIPMHTNYRWLTEVLRNELGFDGFVVSDFFAVEMLKSNQKLSESYTEVGEMALRAGMDLEAPEILGFGAELMEKFRTGKIPMEILDTAVKRVLRIKFRLGLFEEPYLNEELFKMLRCESSINLAYEAALKSAVLLQNRKDILPISEKQKIVVVGPNAKSVQLGDYIAPANIDNGISLYQGLSEKVEGITYEKGCSVFEKDKSFDSAVEAVCQADVAIVAVGDTSHSWGGVGWGDADSGGATCGEGFDSHDLNLPSCQKELIRACAATGTPLVLVLYTGRPYAIAEEIELCDAVVQAWYPGEQGGYAIADLLLGNENFSGKLPISFPRSAGQLPCYYNHKVTARGFYKQPGSLEKSGRDYVFAEPTALYRFGYGLSYSQYEYSNLQVEQLSRLEYKVSVIVKNTSSRIGTEVVQLYLTDDYCRISPYVERLRGFERVTLQPSEEKRITFILNEKDFSFINEEMKPEVESGSFTVRIAELKRVFYITI